MRITPIQHNFKPNTIQKSQSFQGLWGETTRLFDKDPVLGIGTDYSTYYYYPFMDESAQEVQEVVDQNTDAYIDEKLNKYIVKECKICTTLPFKKVHFDNYVAADSSTRMTQNLKKVHYSVQDKYTNNIGEQTPASNSEMKSRLNTKA